MGIMSFYGRVIDFSQGSRRIRGIPAAYESEKPRYLAINEDCGCLLT